MKAGTRLGMASAAAALALAAPPARAQDAPAPPADDPPAEAVGPRELQNFSINGTVTRRAEPPPAPATRPAQTAPATPRTTTPPPASTRPAPAATTNERPVASRPEPVAERAPAVTERDAVTPRVVPAPAPAPRAAVPPRTSPAGSVTVPLPPLDGRVSEGGSATYPDPEGGQPRQRFTAWPWLLAMIALALGGLYLWRSRSRHAIAGFDEASAGHAFAAPEPVAPQPQPQPRPLPPRLSPAPQPAPAPPAERLSPAPVSLGIVSTRLRPRVEFAFTPLRCVVDDERVLVEFELELFNSGSAPARAVLIEASMFNAGPAQDEAIDAFFANPVGEGERITAIAPLSRVSVRSQVAAPRANVQVFNVKGREMFVPLIAFNSLYRWSGGDAQSSSAFLVGRDTGGAKLAPLRTDLGARQFAGLGARPLPNEVRS